MTNERLRARVQAQLELVRASRDRVVEAGDEERRRLERDLHDGAQQRLVWLSLLLGMADEEVATGRRRRGPAAAGRGEGRDGRRARRAPVAGSRDPSRHPDQRRARPGGALPRQPLADPGARRCPHGSSVPTEHRGHRVFRHRRGPDELPRSTRTDRRRRSRSRRATVTWSSTWRTTASGAPIPTARVYVD